MKRLSVVVVDDCDEFRRFLDSFLKAKLPQVELIGSAESMEAALPMIERMQPDLVLLDLGVGPVNGFHATARLKKLEAPPHVLLISANTGKEYRVRAAQVGASGFICKSELYDELGPAIDAILNDQRTAAGSAVEASTVKQS
jgi:DNA-binding NarL/FixJ family response regulator